MQSERIEREEALSLLRTASLLDLMERGWAARQALHPGRNVTFVIDTNPNYTNVCVTRCAFCSFYRAPEHPEAYTLSPAEVAAKVASAGREGATTVLLQGGHHPGLSLPYYQEMITAIREAAPGMHLHLFSPPEIGHIARNSGTDPETVLRTFYDMGLRTMPGGGAEILVDAVRRRVSPGKTSAGEWLDIMRTAHRVGFKTTATMTYGHCERDEDIIEHLFRLRELQDETGGFYAFIPWSFKPGISRLGETVSGPELPSFYVRIIALARIVLDNFPHIQASWFSEGWRAGQLALHGGADDFGGLLLEENVLFQARHAYATTLDALLETIRGAGFLPVQRDSLYNPLKAYDTSEGPGSPAHMERQAGSGAHNGTKTERRIDP